MNGLRLRSNPTASLAYRNLSQTQFSLNNTLQRLSSGLRINKAADDSVGSAISTRMNSQITGMKQANRNAQDVNNLIQTTEGGLNDISGILNRMRELAVQAATDTLNNSDRASIDLEYQALKNEITRIANATQYNEMDILNGGNDILSGLRQNVTNAPQVVEAAHVAKSAAESILSQAQTVLTEAQLNPSYEIQTIRGYEIKPGANLSEANFLSGQNGPTLVIKHANFQEANLSNSTFDQSSISYSDFSRSNLSNSSFFVTDFSNTNFQEANLSAVTRGLRGESLTTFSNVNFTGANLTDMLLQVSSLSDVDFQDANLSEVDLSQSNLSSVNFTGANLSNVNLSSSNLSNVNFAGANLSNTNLQNIIYDSTTSWPSGFTPPASLSETDLKNADLSNADLVTANLSRADLTDANLTGANLLWANLSEATFQNADLSNTDLRQTNRSRADLTGANLSGANLAWANLSEAIYDSETILPSGINPVARNMISVEEGANLSEWELLLSQLKTDVENATSAFTLRESELATAQSALAEAETTLTNAQNTSNNGSRRTFQIGADNDINNQLDFNLVDATTEAIGVDGTDVVNLGSARSSITALDHATDIINNERSRLGSLQNKLQFTMSNLTSQTQSIEAARSSIQDTDFAADAADLAKNQILAQSATAMLAQASAISQNILSLIAG